MMPFKQHLQSTTATSRLAIHSKSANFSKPTAQLLWSYFPELPVLDNILAHLKKTATLPDMKDVGFIGVQHLLPTTGSLFKMFTLMGARPENMFFAGKCYSTDPGVAYILKQLGLYIIDGTKPGRLGEYVKAHNQDVKKLWEAFLDHCKKNNIKKIMILTDGAAVIDYAPPLDDYEVIAVDQTRSSRYSMNVRESRIKIINVAQCAAKQLLEPLFIQRSALERLKPLFETIDKEKTVIGVVGYGAIGKALVKYLVSAGYKTVVYDQDPIVMNSIVVTRNLTKANNLSYLMVNSHYIFGCTGQDITKGINLLAINGWDRHIASLTSEDKEVTELLLNIQKLLDSDKGATVVIDTMSDIEIKTSMGNRLFVIKAGLPCNFSRAETPDPELPFSLIRGLLACAAVFGFKLLESGDPTDSKNIMLDPEVQRFVVGLWQAELGDLQQNDPEIQQLPINNFQHPRWIADHSVGTLVDYPNNSFSNNKQFKVMAKL